MNEITSTIKVGGGNLGFNAAHFITYTGKCEHLHGHNYQVSVELVGPLNEDGLVLDFSILKQIVRRLCQTLDHHFLLPRLNPHMQITEREEEWEISYQQRRYVFPKSDVVALPIDNSTAERLAGYLARMIIEALQASGPTELHQISVGVAETPLQTAYHTQDLREKKR